MIVGVVSDTHGNLEGMRQLAKKLKARNISTILHVGDDYRDLHTLKQAGFQVFGVPGVYCREYGDSAVPNRLLVELGGVEILLSHTETRHRYDHPGDPDPETLAKEVQIVLFGHTHSPTVEDRQGVLWINPGHLRHRPDRGSPPTFALLSLSPEKAAIEIRRLDDDGLVHQKVHRFRP